MSGREGCGRSPKDSASHPSEIWAWLQYAWENIERSRMLLAKGDLRYAVFSASEGLELLVKAYMLRYKLIDGAKAAGHFPYPAVVKAMKKIVVSNMGKNPPDKERRERALNSLRALEGAFTMVKEGKLAVPMRKSSLNIKLDADEKKRVDEFWEKICEWLQEMAQIQGRQPLPSSQGADKLTPAKIAKLFVVHFETNKEKTPRFKDSPQPSQMENKTMLPSSTPNMEQIYVLTELILYIHPILRSSAHQQISRYPTLISGIDSQKIYVEHRDDVEKLIENIHTMSEILLEELKCGVPFVGQSVFATSTTAKEFTPPYEPGLQPGRGSGSSADPGR